MTTDFRVVAQSKDGNFSKSMTIKELLSLLMEQLPVSKVFFVLPHPDGGGYSLREAGTIVLDIQAPAQAEAVFREVLPPLSAPLSPPSLEIVQEVPIKGPTRPLEGVSTPGPLPTYTPPSSTGSITPLVNAMGIPIPKSQRQIAIERGLEPPRPTAPVKPKRAPRKPKATAPTE